MMLEAASLLKFARTFHKSLPVCVHSTIRVEEYVDYREWCNSLVGCQEKVCKGQLPNPNTMEKRDKGTNAVVGNDIEEH